jgi:hypothetical protein
VPSSTRRAKAAGVGPWSGARRLSRAEIRGRTRACIIDDRRRRRISDTGQAHPGNVGRRIPAPTEALACWLMEDANVDMAASRFDRDGVLADASASGLGLAQDNDPDRRAHETERKMTERFSMLISVNIVNSVRDKRIPEGASHKRGLYARCDAPGGSGAADDRRQSRRHESWLPPR